MGETLFEIYTRQVKNKHVHFKLSFRKLKMEKHKEKFAISTLAKVLVSKIVVIKLITLNKKVFRDFEFSFSLVMISVPAAIGTKKLYKIHTIFLPLLQLH